VRRISDPARRLTAATRLLEELRTAQEKVAVLRDSAVRELVQRGASYQNVAVIAGVSRGRVAQIMRRFADAGD